MRSKTSIIKSYYLKSPKMHRQILLLTKSDFPIILYLSEKSDIFPILINGKYRNNRIEVKTTI